MCWFFKPKTDYGKNIVLKNDFYVIKNNNDNIPNDKYGHEMGKVIK